MADDPLIDWEDAFSNGAYIDGSSELPAVWDRKAKAFRDATDSQMDLPYGDHPRETFDLFLPKIAPRGLIVFIHGGYWLAFDKSNWSHLAQGPLAKGWAVAMPSYVLAPVATLPEITEQIGLAVAKAARLVTGPIRLCGHSAGGHLATRMVCTDTPLPPDVSERIDRVLSISGVHDLRPLLHHTMNAQLKLTADSAAQESSALCAPKTGFELISWVGAMERPEFLRQSALIAENWRLKGLETQLVADPDRHHFNVIDGLSDPEHALCDRLTRD